MYIPFDYENLCLRFYSTEKHQCIFDQCVPDTLNIISNNWKLSKKE